MLLGVLGIGALCFGPRYGILAQERVGQQAGAANLSHRTVEEDADQEPRVGEVDFDRAVVPDFGSPKGTPLPAGVSVRVLAQDGAPLAKVGVLARLESPGGELLAETWGQSGADGRLTLADWGRFARQQAPGVMLRIGFESDDPAELVLRAASLPAREFTLVRTVEFDLAANKGEDAAPKDDAGFAWVPADEPAQAHEAQAEEALATSDNSPSERAAHDPQTEPLQLAPPNSSEAAAFDLDQANPAAGETGIVELADEMQATDRTSADKTEESESVALQTEPATPVRRLPEATSTAQNPTPAAPREVPVGALQGRLLLDVPARELFVELDEVLPLDPQRAGRRLGPLVPDADGRFLFTDVQPGLCAVRVGLFGSRRTLMWVDNLDVPVGATLETADLQALDLRGRLGSIAIEVFDHLGQRLESAVVAPLELGSGLVGRLRVQAPGATARVSYDRQAVNGPGSLDLRLEAPGFAPRDVLVTEAELTAGPGLSFALQPLSASPLELRLVGPVPEPSELVAQLVRPDGQVRPWDFAEHRAAFDGAGRLRLTPVETGSFLVRVLRPVDGGWEPVGLDVPIELAPDDGERDIVFIPWIE